METMSHYLPLPSYSDPSNPYVFMDISIDGLNVGRMLMELYANVVPKAAENFRALCTGETVGIYSGKKLHYKGVLFHNVRKDAFAEGGSISGKHRKDDECIYGRFFEDENYTIRHHKPGTLSYVSIGKDTSASRFYILFKPVIILERTHVAFGKVVKGMKVVRRMELHATCSGTPTAEIKITDCGQLSQDEINKEMGFIEDKNKESAKRAFTSDESYDGKASKRLGTCGDDKGVQ